MTSRREEHEALLKALSSIIGENPEVFHNPEGEPFITIRVDGHRENYLLATKGPFRDWCELMFFRSAHAALPDKVFKEVLQQLQAFARFDALVFQTPLRVAEQEGQIFLDLCDKDWRAVEISQDGWRVVTDSPVRFRRSPGMLPLPVPILGGDPKELFQLVNVKNEEHQVLVLAWLLAALRPTGPYTILALHGTQGFAKSTTARILRQLIDPAQTVLSGAPRDERDLLISAKHSHLLGFDNLSSVSDSLSDALCRLATGSGLRTRKLYTDDIEIFFSGARPILLNGISDIATRGDLLHRMIILHLPKIADAERKEEREINQEFEAAQPRILGALLTAASVALKTVDEIPRVDLPRMADFACWAAAGASALGFNEKIFHAAYKNNRKEANFVAYENSPAAVEIFRLMLEEKQWTGTCLDLLRRLNRTVDDQTKRDPAWPQSGRAMKSVLARSGPNLEALGVEIIRLPREAHQRLYHLIFTGSSRPQTIEAINVTAVRDDVTVPPEKQIAA